MRLISFLVIFVSFLCASQDKVEINFKDLQINEFVKMVSKISDKNILLTSKITGKVNFISVKPIKKSQIYDLLISVLKNKGYTLVDSRSGYLQIVRSSDALKESPPFKGQSNLNQIQTDIIGIQNLSAAQMFKQVNFLLSKYGKVAVSQEANSLVITDYPKNLKSIRTLIKKLDSQKKMDIAFYTLQNSKVTSVMPKIKNIANSIYNQKMQSQKVDLFADEGTNTLILVSKQKIIDELLLHVKTLDKKDAVSERYLKIINLKNSDAKIVAETLKTIISNKPVADNKKIKQDLKKPTFTADEETNTLIVYASSEELKEITMLINALDMPRQQVYVSAKIVEISDDKSSKIGAKYGVAGGLANVSGLYTFSASLGGPAIPLSLDGFELDKPSLSKGLALGASISLLNSNGAANVLSEPSLLCVNNLESSIYVGRTESIISEGSVGATTTDVTKNTYTREDIGLTLKVKPRISNDNKVLLDIKVTLEDILPGSEQGMPTTTKRDVATTAIVKNGESIIIGGLVRDKRSKTISKVPLLGDIPLLGYAFRHDEDTNDKTNLVIILTPYIVDKSSDLSSLREILAKLNKIENDFTENIIKNEN
ncbi:type II secretion system secretin GspD [Sulfurospirillum arcachonense]|uniref:type II secretion system secretin GspD n=1 Tax=Sulfurospirillum arcachonense TaxID=57666 RepID=UPI00046A0F4D|nr:type II secretion system secretin GspD [Sulfurospirillum arcachonense]